MSEKANNLWYYQQGGQKVGPVTATDLKKLAGAGKLKSDDQVRKEGMAEWVQASRIKGLFAMPAVVKCSVPIESDRSSTLKSENQARSARETASKPSKASTAPSAAEATPATTQPAKKHGSLADNFKKAAQTALKKSEQLKLTQVTLPSAYQALGKQVYTSGKAQSDIRSWRARSSCSTVTSRPPNRPPPRRPRRRSPKRPRRCQEGERDGPRGRPGTPSQRPASPIGRNVA